MDNTEFVLRVDESMPQIMRYALRLTRKVHDAEDIVQEALLKAFRNRDTLFGNLGAYVKRAVHSCYVDARRKQRLRLTEEFIGGPARGTGSMDALISLEDEARIHDAIDRLPRGAREALTDMIFNDLSSAESAGYRGVKEGTVKSRIYNARKELAYRLPDLVTQTRE